MKKDGMGSHHSANMINDEWLTPPHILKALGEFDLDPCAPIVRPWEMAKTHYTKVDNGLQKQWFGRVWCNPPYGLMAAEWLSKLADHGNGIALIFARTETNMFFDQVWTKADSLLFIKGRLFFYTVEGVKAKSNSGAPSVLVSYSKQDSEILMNSGIEGKFIPLKKQLSMEDQIKNPESEQLNEGSSLKSGYVATPITIEDYAQNVQFQLDNVSGWIGAQDYESALIKARYLVQALELLLNEQKELEKFTKEITQL